MNNDKKVNRVISSCKTAEQARCADTYIVLSARAGAISRVRAVFWGGVLTGIAHVNEWK